MSKIALVTDSTCDLSEAQSAQCRPVVVPLHFDMGGTEYVDGVDMDHETFYRRFRESGQVARSSQPSVGEFVDVYKELLADHDSVVSVHIAHKLSGTVESARQAAEAVDADRVRVVDSKQVSVGLGLVVQTAAEVIQGGADLETVVAAAEAAARATRVYGAVYDLEVAVKGGRVSAPAAYVAGMMSLKPLIVFDKEGSAHIAGARRGYQRALQGMANKVVDYATGFFVRMSIVHANGLESAQVLREQLATALCDRSIPIVPAGAVITTHVGLGTVAVAVQRIEGPELKTERVPNDRGSVFSLASTRAVRRAAGAVRSGNAAPAPGAGD